MRYGPRSHSPAPPGTRDDRGGRGPGARGERTLVALFVEACRDHGPRPFVLEGESVHSFADVARNAERVARGLAARGIEPGARIAILLPDGAGYIAAFFGVLLAGCTAVPIDPRLHRREAELLLGLCVCRALIGASAPPGAGELGPSSCARLGMAALLADPGAAGAPPAIPKGGPAEGDPAVILCTSGSTRAPKAVVLTHCSLFTNQRAFSERCGMTRDDVMVSSLSLCHSFGMTAWMLTALANGCAMVIPDEALPGRIAALAARHRATVLLAAASFYSYLVRSSACRREDLATLRCCLSGACALAREVAARFTEKFGHEIVQTYGLTEASPVVTANPPGDNRIGTVGTALEGVELTIVDERGQPAAEGELCVRGELVMQGYLGNASDTAACLDGAGWLRTGDLARLDRDGYVTLLGRAKDVIIRAGSKLYPDEIEEVLHEHPGVAEAAVVGLPDPAYEEIPVAFIVWTRPEPLDPLELQAFCRDRMALFKVPRLFRVVPALPRNPNGKVLKRTLREWLSGTPGLP